MQSLIQWWFVLSHFIGWLEMLFNTESFPLFWILYCSLHFVWCFNHRIANSAVSEWSLPGILKQKMLSFVLLEYTLSTLFMFLARFLARSPVTVSSLQCCCQALSQVGCWPFAPFSRSAPPQKEPNFHPEHLSIVNGSHWIRSPKKYSISIFEWQKHKFKICPLSV